MDDGVRSAIVRRQFLWRISGGSVRRRTLSFADFMASEIENWIFHPNQEISYREDGTCVVSFRAGGIDEMLWHFFTWGDLLTIEQPKWLRDAMNAKCASLADHHAQ